MILVYYFPRKYDIFSLTFKQTQMYTFVHICVGNLGKGFSLQISLKRNPSNFHCIFLLDMYFENLIVRLHILITFFMFAKF